MHISCAFVCLQELISDTHTPFLHVCKLRGVLWHYRKSGSTSLGKRDKILCVCAHACVNARLKARPSALNYRNNKHMNKYTTMLNQANPAMSLWFLHVGAFHDLCVIVLHIPFSQLEKSHNLLFGSLKWDIQQYPTKSPPISSRKQDGQCLPSCFGTSEKEELLCW